LAALWLVLYAGQRGELLGSLWHRPEVQQHQHRNRNRGNHNYRDPQLALHSASAAPPPQFDNGRGVYRLQDHRRDPRSFPLTHADSIFSSDEVAQLKREQRAPECPDLAVRPCRAAWLAPRVSGIGAFLRKYGARSPTALKNQYLPGNSGRHDRICNDLRLHLADPVA
jgi:hypothetical protein